MPKKLLLADDSITIQKVIGITFANEEFALTTVDNGTDAIAAARRLKPDLILADVVMPGKNGYEVCEYVKHDPALRSTPVLLLAGTFESFDEAEMARVGADGYITKPFESQALIDKVHELISRAGSGRAAPKGPAPGAEEFNLEDFSPFEEMASAAGAASPAAAAGGWDAEKGTGDEDAWDLSDFEPSGEAGGPEAPDAGGDAGPDETAFAEEPAAGAGDAATLEDEPLELDEDQVAARGGRITGEAVYDFGEPDAEPLPGSPGGSSPRSGAPVEPRARRGALAGEGGSGLDFGEGAGSGADPFETGAAEEAADPFADASLAGDVDDVQELADFEEITEADDLAPEPGEAAGEPLVPAGAADGWEVAPVADVGEVGALAGRIRAAAEGLAAEVRDAAHPVPREQVEAIVSRVARQVIEEVAWEVVPDLCEALIREEIRKLTAK